MMSFFYTFNIIYITWQIPVMNYNIQFEIACLARQSFTIELKVQKWYKQPWPKKKKKDFLPSNTIWIPTSSFFLRLLLPSHFLTSLCFFHSFSLVTFYLLLSLFLLKLTTWTTHSSFFHPWTYLSSILIFPKREKRKKKREASLCEHGMDSLASRKLPSLSPNVLCWYKYHVNLALGSLFIFLNSSFVIRCKIKYNFIFNYI